MSKDSNPYIEPENFFAGYQESIEKLKNNQEAVDFDKMCYAVFNTKAGKELLHYIEQRYLIPSLAARGSHTYSDDLMFFEGFKEGFRHIKTCVEAHGQRIATELNKDDR